MNFSRGLILCSFLFFQFSFAQSISGTISDAKGNRLSGATIRITPTNSSIISDTKGEFLFSDIKTGNYNLTVNYLGYKTVSQPIKVDNGNNTFNFILEEDLLYLNNVIVTGNFAPKTLLASAATVSVVSSKAINNRIPRGTADLLSEVPGTFVDASAGEVFTRVYSRGISASAEDDMGWYYASLQEDGLPVSLVQHSYYGPDLFHRVDITTERVEAVTGGSSAITALNAPGGIYNFISQGVHEKLSGKIRLGSNLQGNDNNLYKVEGTIGGTLGNNWYFNFGGHYRRDQGIRDTDFTFGKGGQIKYNLIKKTKKGSIKFYGKVLSDNTNRYTGVAATNWEEPQAAFGQDFNSTALLMPAYNGTIPDGRFISENKTNSFDPSQGVKVQDISFGLDINQELGNNWSIHNNGKFSNKIANWQTSISNAFVSLSNPLAYFITGSPFPIGQVVFKEATSGQELARVDNSGILAGESFQYIGEGTLPNDAIMGTSAWYKDNTSKEFIDQLTIRKQLEKHDINFGVALGLANTETFTQGTFGFVTYEPNPRMLQVTLENPNVPIEALSDANGLSNYGGLFFVNARADVSQFAAFASDRFILNDKLEFDIGLRWETINHDGIKDRYAPFITPGGIDGDATTSYDNSVNTPTGEQDTFDFNYKYLSYSLGINYSLSDKMSLFTRFSRGNKAPELNYYFNNFSNIEIPNKGEIQKINQAELGLKWNAQNFSLQTTAFWSQLSDIGSSNFEFDEDTNTVFYSPVQFNTSTTIGLEWEAAYSLSTNLNFSFGGTIQKAEATNWKVYDAAGSVATDDDTILDYSGNNLPFNPTSMFNLGTAYDNNKFNTFLKWQFMGKREGNVANAFQLDSYSIFNFGAGYSITKNLEANLLITNLFNSEGLANFFGANSFGASANGVTKEFIQDNPDASFVVVPVLPRASMVQLSYSF
ncbi:TonB-dependent receptor-like protein [Maribacter vaceletii]|uniref:TonB-dependent receptor-like protein n=1 Tax=Maribacter vaceletii TaxID=1206816 RepID=A0A495EAY3_9FLAO|nr:TonB-dependent receptor [Maribacter vaceletii]RKR13047.1 TonB-dependent receptor-like protein [Maribacter vaceletii]